MVGAKIDNKPRNPDLLLTFLYILALVVLFLIFKPYIAPLVLGGIIVIFLYPVNAWMQKKIKSKVWSSTIMLILVLLIILIPSVFLVSSLAHESSKAYDSFSSLNLTEISYSINSALGTNFNIEEVLTNSITKGLEYISNSAVDLLGTVTEFVIGVFIMFFFVYYGFKDGKKFETNIIEMLPIRKLHRKHVINETRKVLWGVMYGQFLVAMIQGILGGIGFWIFGLPNPILWGFMMAVLAFLPVVGTPIIWLPASLFAISAGNVGGGVGMLIYGGIVVTQIDNLIKPKIIGDNSGMHPLLVMVGIFGGLAVFGIIGFILGPILVAFCTLAIKFFIEELNQNEDK